MIIRNRKSSRQVITTKNNQDSLDSATAPHTLHRPILSRAAARELVKLNRCAEVHHRTGVRASHAGRGFS